MFNKTIVTSALLLALASPFASAYQVVSTEVVKGTIDSVNADANVVVLDHDLGTQELSLDPSAKIFLDGETAALTDLPNGEKVSIKRVIYTPSSETIEGEIVSLDRKELTARIRVASNEIVKVKFNDGVAVNGLVEDFSSLRKGHTVIVRTK